MKDNVKIFLSWFVQVWGKYIRILNYSKRLLWRRVWNIHVHKRPEILFQIILHWLSQKICSMEEEHYLVTHLLYLMGILALHKEPSTLKHKTLI